jgi:LPXTG-motif cell wall-anchored protein
MRAVLRWRVALVSALSAATLIAAPLVGTQTAYARSYPPSPGHYPPRPHPGETQDSEGHPRPDDSDGLAETGVDSGTVMLLGGVAVALITAGGGGVLVVRRRRNSDSAS